MWFSCFFFSFSLSFNRCFEVPQNAFVHKAKNCLLFFFVVVVTVQQKRCRRLA